MIKTIIFDIGGVVTDTDFEAIHSSFATKIGISPDVIINYVNEKKDDLLLGNISFEQFWKEMKDAGGTSNTDYKALWIAEGIKHREVNKGLLGVIEKLRKHYLVGALTNLTESRFILDEQMDLYSHFDYAVLSYEEHLKKPDFAFYNIALSRASAKPEEAIFIDDKEKCTIPAEQLGMKSILYKYPDNDALIYNLHQLGVSL
ncbi:MAG: HAD family phosphatase [Candidatus Zambryskibacteria bacterium]|nr:HAD family phosphatase [Candidatus Zambryskibacteria bacterium]